MVFLVDVENTNSAGFDGVEFLEENDTVILFYSAVSKNVESWVLDGLFKSKCKIETCMLKKQCKNGLDFYIASKLGYLVGVKTTPTIFCIVSADKGYDAVRDFWNIQSSGSVRVILSPTIQKCILLAHCTDNRTKKCEDSVKICDLSVEINKHLQEAKKKVNATKMETVLGEYEKELERVEGDKKEPVVKETDKKELERVDGDKKEPVVKEADKKESEREEIPKSVIDKTEEIKKRYNGTERQAIHKSDIDKAEEIKKRYYGTESVANDADLSLHKQSDVAYLAKKARRSIHWLHGIFR